MENLEQKKSRVDRWILLGAFMLPLPLRSVPPEVLLPVPCSPFHPEARAACRNSDCLIPEMVCPVHMK